MVAAFRTFDNLSDRRDLFRLLERLSLGVSVERGCARRKAVLLAFARQAGFGEEQIILGDGTTAETYTLIVALCAQLKLDIEKVAIWVEERVRRMPLRR